MSGVWRSHEFTYNIIKSFYILEERPREVENTAHKANDLN